MAQSASPSGQPIGHPSAQVVPFPAHLPRLSASYAPVPRQHRLRLAEVAALLGLDQLDRRTQIEKLRALHKVDGLPLPINPRVWGGSRITGPRAICAASLWDGQAVLAWLHRPGPAAPAAEAPPAPVTLRADLAARARRISAGGRA